MLSPAIKGFTLGASLIVAIGSQNAFVLQQGLRKEFVFTICTICFLCDAILILLGVGGFGQLIASSESMMLVARWGGALFLIVYGIRSFRSACKDEAMKVDTSDKQTNGLTWAVSTTFALTLLNPHVYLDTVILLGSIAGQYPESERLFFATGAVFASMTWFYGLGFGARVLTPFFPKQLSLKILDGLIGAIMWGIAGGLIFS